MLTSQDTIGSVSALTYGLGLNSLHLKYLVRTGERVGVGAYRVHLKRTHPRVSRETMLNCKEL